MLRIRYKTCDIAGSVMIQIAREIGIDMKAKIGVVVSRGARAKAYARIFGLPIPIQIAHSVPPMYTIEFLCERVDGLGSNELAEIAVHELLHIPRSQRGGLRPHGKLVNARKVRKLASRVDSNLKDYLYETVASCCHSF
ncbi:MAG: putative metallopeptidase [Fervidicoccaceae archaeon]